MIKIPKFKILFLLSAFCFLLALPTAQAVQLKFISQIQEIAVGEQLQIDLSIDTENEAINALEGKIIFPYDILELKEIRDGNSIINFWIEKPQKLQTTNDEQQGEIIFSGITPGGYQGEKGLIFSLIFQSEQEGSGKLEILNAKSLRNDGNGTETALSLSPLQFIVSREAPQFPITLIEDNENPESFLPEIARDPNLFENKWFLVFVAQDKGSGIDYYQIKETKQGFFGNFSSPNWNKAESPYLLKDQNLQSYIFVKAIDKSGNARTEKILPQNPLKWYENYADYIIIILTLVFVIIYALKRIYGKKT